jgi:hypothetical protein
LSSKGGGKGMRSGADEDIWFLLRNALEVREPGSSRQLTSVHPSRDWGSGTH